jgi:hypothetical protein
MPLTPTLSPLRGARERTEIEAWLSILTVKVRLMPIPRQASLAVTRHNDELSAAQG